MRRIGEIIGTCPHGVHILSVPCGFCERERGYQPIEELQPDGISQLGERIIEAFNQQHSGINGHFPVWVGTKEELSKGLLRLELQRSWKEGYSGAFPLKLEINITVKPALSWWRRWYYTLLGGLRAHFAPRHGSQV